MERDYSEIGISLHLSVLKESSWRMVGNPRMISISPSEKLLVRFKETANKVLDNYTNYPFRHMHIICDRDTIRF